jgi:hypothetical protein
VLVDTALGVGVGVVAVGLYLVILRWQARDDDRSPSGDGKSRHEGGESRHEDAESRHEDGSPGKADEKRSDR